MRSVEPIGREDIMGSSAQDAATKTELLSDDEMIFEADHGHKSEHVEVIEHTPFINETPHIVRLSANSYAGKNHKIKFS